MAQILLTVTIIFAGLVALLYNPVQQRLTVFGAFRTNITNMHGHRLIKIPNTLQCEDLHHHLPSNLLFTACQTDDRSKRHAWFPPFGLLNETGIGQGTIVTIDPTTFEATHLELKGFKGPFVTHGIDIHFHPSDPSHVTIFAVNHLRNKTAAADDHENVFASQIEVFKHTIGTKEARYIRSIRHPLVQTPNDIYATSPTSFYVTNDFAYKGGRMKVLEFLGTRPVAGWSTTIHVSFDDTERDHIAEGVTAHVALTGLHNNNGLGHTSNAEPDTVLVCDAGGGEMNFAKRNLNPRPGFPEDLKLEVFDRVQFDSMIDNPTYYHDPYAFRAHMNASGYVLAGLYRGTDIFKAKEGPPVLASGVWYLHQDVIETEDGYQTKWNKKIIFQDDGLVAGSSATAVLVGIDPAQNEGKKQGWLFVTGFMSDNMVASLIDL